MKRKSVFFVLFCTIATQVLWGQIPQTISYQGVLTDAGGQPVPDGNYNLTFRLYEVATGGNSLWAEGQLLAVKGGIFNAILGSVSPLTLAFDKRYWLGVTVGAGTELTPRIELTASAYSLNAKSIVDGAVTTAKLANNAVTPAKINSSGAMAGQALVYDGSNVVWSAPSGGGLTLPFAMSGTVDDTSAFHIRNSGSGDAIFGTALGTGNAIEAFTRGSGNALRARTNGTGSAGFFEITNSVNSFPVLHATTAGSGVGVFGEGGRVGVSGRGLTGVLGASFEQNGRGIIGRADSASAYGVWGISSRGHAGRFDGNVGIAGILTKTVGAFKIDHPLDPANKYLYHSFVESPDMMNIYNGNVMLDANGEAWVELPAWFEALNRDFRYQLTAIGAPGPSLYIAEEISGNRFKIAGGSPGLEVSWQVTGVHQARAARFLSQCQNRLQTKDAVIAMYQLLAQRRAEVRASEISKNPNKEILEPGFRIIFPEVTPPAKPGKLRLTEEGQLHP